MERREYADQVEQDYCPLCGGGCVVKLPRPIPVIYRQFVRDLCPSPVSPEDEDWHTVTCACAVFNQWDQPASIGEYAQAFNDLTACYLGTATPQQWFRVCVTASDLPDPEVVNAWAAKLNVSADKVAW